MANPTITSGLIETPAPAANNDAPRAGTVFVVGPAGSGPTVPLVFDNPSDAYDTYGSQDSLARDIELALIGASFGARAAGSGRYARVVGLRTRTGSAASATLVDGSANTVMTIETVEQSERANSWSITQTRSGYRVFDPTVGTSGQYTDFTVDFTGVGVGDRPASVSELADAMRAAFANKLYITVEYGTAHWELSVDDSTANISITSTADSTEVDFSTATDTQLDAIKSGATTWIDGVAAYFADPEFADAHQRIIAEDNATARIYAITAGKAVEVPKDTETVQIEKLGDAKRIGLGLTNSLLNIRTTGVGAGGSVTLQSAGERNGAKKSEGYWRVRDEYVSRFDPTETTTTFLTAPTFEATVASTADFSIAGLPQATITMDGVALELGDIVFLKNQGTATENGLYTVIDNGGDLDFSAVAVADSNTVDVLKGTAGAGKRFTIVNAAAGTISEAAGVASYVVSFDAPNGIADAGGPLAQKYASQLGLVENSTNADLVSTDKLGTAFSDIFKMKMTGVVPGALPTSINLDLTGAGNADAVAARVAWDEINLKGKIILSKSSFDTIYGEAFDDGYVYVSYDSCIFDLVEKNNTTLLTANTSAWEYAVSGDIVTFNKPLTHALVVRGTRVTQYRMGNDVIVERTDTGNKFTFVGKEKQPGEAGGVVGKMEVILGFDYKFESAFPTVSSTTKLTGGASGVNADAETKVKALNEALKEYKDQEYAFLVPSGVFVDDSKVGFDSVTGAAVTASAGLMTVLKAHQDRVSATGASGVVYASVKRMKPSSNSGRYTDAVKETRFVELTEANPLLPERAATVIQSNTYPDFFIFDAPFAATLNGVTVETSGTAFFAGMRSAMPNDRALYQIELPRNIQPLYRFDVNDADMPGILADARINTWSSRRGEVRLADERTAAGLIPDSRGKLVPSSFQSGVALLSSKEFLQSAVRELRNLLGPLPSSGIDSLRATTETILRGIASRTIGVQGFDVDPQRDISIYAQGGNALSMDIRLFLQVNGELRKIDIRVGAITQAGAAQSTQAVIPVIG